MFWKEFPSSDFENHTARGIPNSGYYCYRNSTVQALLHVPALYDYFTNHHRESCKSIKHYKYWAVTNRTKGERERTNCICCLLGIFAKYHYSDETCSENAKSKALALIDKSKYNSLKLSERYVLDRYWYRFQSAWSRICCHWMASRTARCRWVLYSFDW